MQLYADGSGDDGDNQRRYRSRQGRRKRTNYACQWLSCVPTLNGFAQLPQTTPLVLPLPDPTSLIGIDLFSLGLTPTSQIYANELVPPNGLPLRSILPLTTPHENATIANATTRDNQWLFVALYYSPTVLVYRMDILLGKKSNSAVCGDGGSGGSDNFIVTPTQSFLQSKTLKEQAPTYTLTLRSAYTAAFYDMIITPDGRYACVINLQGEIVLINITNLPDSAAPQNQVVLPLGYSVNIVVAAADSQTVYVMNYFFGYITPISLSRHHTPYAKPTVQLPGVGSGMLSIDPMDASMGYIAMQYDGTLAQRGQIDILRMDRLEAIDIVYLPSMSMPYGTCVPPNQRLLYVACGNGSIVIIGLPDAPSCNRRLSPSASSLTFKYTVLRTIDLSGGPNAGTFWLAPTPDSRRVMILSTDSQTMATLRTCYQPCRSKSGRAGSSASSSTGYAAASKVRLTSVFTFDEPPQNLMITTDEAPVARFTWYEYAPDSSSVLLDASSSYSPVGTIVSYEWTICECTAGNRVITVLDTCSPVRILDASMCGLGAGVQGQLRPRSCLVKLRVTNSAGTSTGCTSVWSSRFWSRRGSMRAECTQLVRFGDDRRYSCCLRFGALRSPFFIGGAAGGGGAAALLGLILLLLLLLVLLYVGLSMDTYGYLHNTKNERDADADAHA